MPQGNKIKINTIIYFCLAVVFLIAGVAGGVLMHQESEKVKTETAVLRKEIEAIQAKLRSYDSLEAELDRLNLELDKLAFFIPDKEGQAAFVRELEELAVKNKIKINTCDIDKNTVEIGKLPNYVGYRWKLGITAEYQGLMKFMASLKEASRLIKVSDISINGSEINDKLNVSLILDLISKSTAKKVK